MNILDRHLAKTVLGSICIILLLLTVLQIFILSVDQMNSIGQGHYHIMTALLFVILQTPYQIYLFFPMACLLGTLIGLGILAQHHELVIMRASGLSVLQLSTIVLKTTIGMVILVVLLGESLLPRGVSYSNQMRMEAMNNGQTLKTTQGIWLRKARDWITIHHINPDKTLTDIFQYRFTPTQRLLFARHIQKLQYIDKKWHAYDIAETQFQSDKTLVHHLDEILWDTDINPTILNLGMSEPDEMSLPELYRFTQYLQQNKNNATRYALAFWQRVLKPFTTMVMIFLAIPFIFGPLRSSTMGAKILAGSAAGFGFFIFNQFISSLGLVYHWPPFWVALTPGVFFMLSGFYGMKKVR